MMRIATYLLRQRSLIVFLVHTSRSVVLLMQVSLPCMLFASGPTQVTLKGGTNADMAPQIDFTTMVSLSY